MSGRSGPWRQAPRSAPVVIRSARGPRDIEAVRGLFQEYRQWLANHREVTTFSDAILKTGLSLMDAEIASLPGPYAPRRGVLVLGIQGERPIACGAVRPLSRNVGEIKRLFVRPALRGAGVGRSITQALLSRARRRGYRRVVLDTLPTMTAAIRLYRDLGFTPIPPYWKHPFPRALFFEYRFPSRSARASRLPSHAERPEE